jgi:hypothetical protein
MLRTGGCLGEEKEHHGHEKERQDRVCIQIPIATLNSRSRRWMHRDASSAHSALSLRVGITRKRLTSTSKDRFGGLKSGLSGYRYFRRRSMLYPEGAWFLVR